MKRFAFIVPLFLRESDSAYSQHFLNLRRIWLSAITLIAIVVIVPLALLSYFYYEETKRYFESEILLRTSRLVSNARRTLFYFIEERKLMTDVIVKNHDFRELTKEKRLRQILANLQSSYPGLVDIGIVDASGVQIAYAGPYDLMGKSYRELPWFHEVSRRGFHISDVSFGYRNVPHFSMAFKHPAPRGSFYVVRVSVDTMPFDNILSSIQLTDTGDVFLINREGLLQSSSNIYGKTLEKISLVVPPFSESSQVFQTKNAEGTPLIIGYAYIKDTPFILMIIKQKEDLMRKWYKTNSTLVFISSCSILIILIVILVVVTHLVNRIYIAQQKELHALHSMETSEKLASLGRLAAGVAHEINNPLAIINQKAGLIKDLFTIKKQYAHDQKLLGTVDSIQRAVERCTSITKRLLGFAREKEGKFEFLGIRDTIDEVISFVRNEAQHRNITISVEEDGAVPQIETEKGKLQQVLLNIINNALSAIDKDGSVKVAVRNGEGTIVLAISDTGSGIPEREIKHIFEPFFTTKGDRGGTGLGLFITYSLVQELGGTIEVESTAGAGTTFTVTLPVRKEAAHESSSRG